MTNFEQVSNEFLDKMSELVPEVKKRVWKGNVAPEELRQKEQVGGPVNCSDSELSIYLQALEAGFLPTYYSDTNQFVQLKSMSIASRSYQHGKKTVYFHGFQSLTMYKNSTEPLGAELLT